MMHIHLSLLGWAARSWQWLRRQFVPGNYTGRHRAPEPTEEMIAQRQAAGGW